MKELIVIFVILTIGLANGLSFNYANEADLEMNYKIHWTVLNDEIRIALEVRTAGWIGFGIGEPTSGSMPGADIVHAHITLAGEVMVYDRYALVKGYPDEDICNDWQLVGGQETNGTTIVELKRKLITNDPQDRNIVPGPNRIIWAYGTQDTFGYHGQNRMVGAITFYGSVQSVPAQDQNVQSFIVETNDTFIRPQMTDYQCAYYKLPLNASQDYHVIEFEALIDPKAVQYVHHFILSYCDNDNTTWFTDDLSTPQGCELNWKMECPQTVMWGWAPGVGKFEFPQDVGVRMGNSPGAIKIAHLQVHYHNPNLLSNIQDNSKVVIRYTDKLRQYDGGVVELGDISVSAEDIAPQVPFKHYEFSCDPSCTQTLPHDIHVFTDTLHMHEVGTQIYSTHWRGNEFLGTLNRIDFWDFDLQQTTSNNRTIKPGDRINTHCIYNSMSRNNITRFGTGSKDEMCINFVYYYPKVPKFNFCGYVRDRNSGQNYTACNSDIIDQRNPLTIDSIDNTSIQFGIAPAVCKKIETGTGLLVEVINANSSYSISISPIILCILLFILVSL